ncbi:MAG: hypothetical protein ACK5IQ_01825 [Bacteroidales bacterium]
MKFVKRSLQGLLFIILILILFRGWIYRHSVSYVAIGERSAYCVSSEELKYYIDSTADCQLDTSIEDLVRLSLSITSQHLSFTTSNNEVNPNKLIYSKTAHCVGYATFFASTCNYILDRYGMGDKWTAKARRGQLYLFGENVHKYFSSPFFKDHDFVLITNKTTGEVLAVDPTLNDYLHIDLVRCR